MGDAVTPPHDGGTSRRRVTAMLAGVAGIAACGIEQGGDAPGPAIAPPSPPAPAPSPDAFPLSVSDNRRHLIDRSGAPFLIHGDSPWSLIADLPASDAVAYLDDRQARGFNTLLVNLLERRFARNSPSNAAGEPPFLTPGDFRTPNERYFGHADYVLSQAAERGMLMLLAPAYLGYSPDEGWSEVMSANGADALRDYGRFLGRRFSVFDNIIWTHGGDSCPADKSFVRAIAEGVREEDPQALHTAHAAPEMSAQDCWPDEGWLDVNTLYSYEGIVEAAQRALAGPGAQRPFFLLEAAYEHEHGADAAHVRAQAYQALLSGGCGHLYGANPVWHFEGPGLYSTALSWRDALDSDGARSMTVLKNLFAALPWFELTPDVNGALLRTSRGSAADLAVAAVHPEGRLALIYVPTQTTLRLDLSVLEGERVEASWIDPATGAFHAVSGAPFSLEANVRVATPTSNAGGADDWLLMLRV